MNWWQTLFVCFVVWNSATFVVTAGDKRAAKRRKSYKRTPERRFLFFAATLGGAGVLVAFYAVRHKTKHTSLLAGVWTLSALSYAILAAALWMWRTA